MGKKEEGAGGCKKREKKKRKRWGVRLRMVGKRVDQGGEWVMGLEGMREGEDGRREFGEGVGREGYNAMKGGINQWEDRKSKKEGEEGERGVNKGGGSVSSREERYQELVLGVEMVEGEDGKMKKEQAGKGGSWWWGCGERGLAGEKAQGKRGESRR